MLLKAFFGLINLPSKIRRYQYKFIKFHGGNTVKSNKLFFGKDCEFYNPRHIKFGNNVVIGNGSIITAIKSFKAKNFEQTFEPLIEIGSNVQATGRLQIHSMIGICIEDDVLIATNVFMADGFHGYDDATIPYKDQPMNKLSKIVIGQGAWIGQNVVIMPGVKIGKQTVIGANSVVTKDIPQKCIAVGNPCRVIKTWDDLKKAWISI